MGTWRSHILCKISIAMTSVWLILVVIYLQLPRLDVDLNNPKPEQSVTQPFEAKLIKKTESDESEKIFIESSEKFTKKQHSASFQQLHNIFDSESLGENGKAVTMPSKVPPQIKAIYDKGWNDHQFNQYVSDLISVNRTLSDNRSDYCKSSNYSQSLPATSVIIIFYNEAWSTLVRSVHSVLNRSPEHLITEVILVDDFSDMRKFDGSHSNFKL